MGSIAEIRRRRLPVGRVIGVLVLAGLVPLGLLTYTSVHLQDQAVRREVEARVSTTASVSSMLVQQQMESLGELVTSYATRPLMVNAVGDGSPLAFKADVVTGQLAELSRAGEGISGAFMTDVTCRLTAAVPATPGIIGKDFGFRDWCRGITAGQSPYVSEAYRSQLAGEPLVVAVAASVRSPAAAGARSAPVAILTAVYSIDALRSFANNLAVAQGIDLTITDHRGSALSETERASQPSTLRGRADDPRIREALAGRSGVTSWGAGDVSSVSAHFPVEGIGWTVTAEVPRQKAFAGLRLLRSRVLSIAAVLGAVLLAGVVLLIRVLRQRQVAERTWMEAEARTLGILNAASDAFISMGADGIITAWNPRAETLFGWTNEEAVGRCLSECVIPPRLRQAHEEGLRRFLTSGDGPVLGQRIEISAVNRAGDEFPVELAIWPVESSGTWTFNAFVHDITERKAHETELAEARDQALEASLLKSEFLANMSHEIRTPMNGVLGMTALLLDSELTVQQRDFANTVQQSGDSLLGIIDDILDFSKIEAGRLDLESIDFDLQSLVEDVADMLAVRAHDKGLELTTSVSGDVPTAVRGDPGRLRQVLTNLIGNAIKFTEHGQVSLELTSLTGASARRDERERQEGQLMVHFQIVDTGIGVAPEAQAGIFESFSQADSSTTRRYGGTGLGLSISRQLVELMGGTIAVRSSPGEGSTFSFTLPLDYGESSARSTSRAGLAGLRALVVDDNATNRAILSRFLQAWDIQAVTAEDAASGLVALREAATAGEPFDVAVVDLHMPLMDGLQMARAMRADAALASVRSVLLTSSGQRGEAGLAEEAGMDGYLTKPVRQAHLYGCLATVMGVDDGEEQRHIVTRYGLTGRTEPRGRVLVAEDNSVNQKVAVGMLEKLGYQVDVAFDGAEAVEAAAVTGYDAVLMDCQMPRMDGFAATRSIRKSESGRRHTPIIALTASAMDADRQRCLDAGMDGYLSKPIRLDDLAASLGLWALPVPGAANGGPGEPDAPQPERPGPEASDPEVVARMADLSAAMGADLVTELGEIFSAEAPRQVAMMRAALAQTDRVEVSMAAHALRGSSANLGARHLSEICAELEDGGEWADTSRLIDSVDLELLRVYRAFYPEEAGG